jgi:hypothetical protein
MLNQKLWLSVNEILKHRNYGKFKTWERKKMGAKGLGVFSKCSRLLHRYYQQCVSLIAVFGQNFKV